MATDRPVRLLSLFLAVLLGVLSSCSALRRSTVPESTPARPAETRDTLHTVRPAAKPDTLPAPSRPLSTKSGTMLLASSTFSPDIEAGQYSGITWMGGNRYAVVHDKLSGGGIVDFQVDIDPASGVIRSVSLHIPDATRFSNVTGRDNEGITYAEGKLFVSAESDQSIREYELDGTPTGRELAVPAAFGRDRIHGNAGFEALGYSPLTGLFWTTTEKPLAADKAIPRLHRLQSFGTDLQPRRQYLYQMDEPRHSAEATRAYVHGISALTALDDGRLVVLEREVYVPASIFRALSETVSIIKLYLVDPTGHPDTPLPKTLLDTFSTTAVDLANYEGMCLGPVLDDGSRTLVLIADSQGGMSGLTQEYLKVIVFRP